MIEETLNRIAIALETIARNGAPLLNPAVLNFPTPMADAPEVAEAAAPKPGRGRPRKTESSQPNISESVAAVAAGVASVSEPAAQAPTSAQPASPAAGTAVSYDELRDVILKLTAEKGRAATIQLLKDFGVATAKELKPEQYESVMNDAEALMAPSDDLA